MYFFCCSESEDIQHAIGVCKSMMYGDNHTFFKLYVNAPKMAGFVMDFFVVSLSHLRGCCVLLLVVYTHHKCITTNV